MAFAIKGQTKAAVAIKGNFGVFGPILFKLCVHIAYSSPGTPGYMAFAIKGHVTRRSRSAISYVHAKFEQNQPTNTRDMA